MDTKFPSPCGDKLKYEIKKANDINDEVSVPLRG